jgi:hypothetical protein
MVEINIPKPQNFNRYNNTYNNMQKEVVDLGIFSILAVLKCTKDTHKKGLFRTQIAKLLYLTHKLKRVNVGYRFRDDNFGPYDRQIELDLTFSKDVGTIKEEILDSESINISTKHFYEITELGENEVEKYSGKFNQDEIITAIKEICEKYGNLGTKELLDVVYKQHYKDFSELKKDIISLKGNLKKLFVILDNQYKIKFSKTIDNLLIKIEYCNYILNKLDKIESRTDKNIVIQEIKILFDEVSLVIDNIEEIKDSDDIEEIFIHLNSIAKESGLPTYDDEDLDLTEFLEEDDLKCLMERTTEVS